MRTKLTTLLLVGAAAAVPALGCGPTHGYVVASYEEPPPLPRREVVVYRPGHVWVSGYWVRDARDRWRWRSGYYARERPGRVWVDGRWERRGNRYIWVDGGWRARGSVVVRPRYRR